VAASPSSMDGLVLAFVSSRNTELVHCIDLTVRCNPSSSSRNRNGSGPSGAMQQPQQSELLEDLDGWRGYFSPFLALPTPGGGGGGAAETSAPGGSGSDIARRQEELPRVVALACCRIPSGSTKKLHVACVGPSNLVVWEDPHLHLSCRRPITSPGKLPAEAVAFSPAVSAAAGGATPLALPDGRCQAVDIQPGMVVVGMDVRIAPHWCQSSWFLSRERKGTPCSSYQPTNLTMIRMLLTPFLSRRPV
jgi:hypothetical protein